MNNILYKLRDAWFVYVGLVRHFPDNFLAVNNLLRTDPEAGKVLLDKMHHTAWTTALELSMYLVCATMALFGDGFWMRNIDIATIAVQTGLWIFFWSLCIDGLRVYLDALSDLAAERVVSVREKLFKLAEDYSSGISCGGSSDHRFVWSSHRIKRLSNKLHGTVLKTSGNSVCVLLVSACNVLTSDASTSTRPTLPSIPYFDKAMHEFAEIADMLVNLEEEAQ